MKFNRLMLTLLLGILCSGSLVAQANDSTKAVKFKKDVVYRLQTKEGTVYIGYILEYDSLQVRIENKTTQQVYSIAQNEIETLAELKKKIPRLTDLYGENPHTNFYMLSQTAMPLRAKQIDAHYHWLGLEHAEYAFNENWALSVNSLLFAPLSFGFKAHYAFSEDLHAGLSVFGTGNLLSAATTGSSSFLGIFALGKLTKGQSNRNVTISAGALQLYTSVSVAGLFGTSSNRNQGLLYFASAAGTTRVGKKVCMIGESWFFPQLQMSLTGGGVKLVGNESTSWTLGCYGLYFGRDINFTQLKGRILPIPYLSYSNRL